MFSVGSSRSRRAQLQMCIRDSGEAEENGLSDEPLSLAERAKGSKWFME